MANTRQLGIAATAEEVEPGMTAGEMLDVLRRHLKLLVVTPVVVSAVALGVTYLMPPTFTAQTTFIPPQQTQSAAASALASLGPLASLAGGAVGRTSGEQYVALMSSVTVSDRLVDAFKLMDVYESKYRVEARKELGKNVRITLGKKDGLISVEVDDVSPKRAADIANRYVDELRRVTSGLAVTEAQQRRVFFETQLKQSRDRLTKAQIALQESGFNAGALKAEPKAAADGYARLLAAVTAVQVQLQALRGTLTDNAPEVQRQQATLNALQDQLQRAERSSSPATGPDYVGRYREFKYQEVLFELYARQYELARVDESREGTLIQIVDLAIAPERKSKPRRTLIALAALGISALALTAGLLLVEAMRRQASRPAEGGGI